MCGSCRSPPRGRMDTMTVRIERHPALDRATREAAAEVLKQRIKVHVGSARPLAARTSLR